MVLLLTQRSDGLICVCLEQDASDHNVHLPLFRSLPSPKHSSDFYHSCLNEQCNSVTSVVSTRKDEEKCASPIR